MSQQAGFSLRGDRRRRSNQQYFQKLQWKEKSPNSNQQQGTFDTASSCSSVSTSDTWEECYEPKAKPWPSPPQAQAGAPLLPQKRAAVSQGEQMTAYRRLSFNPGYNRPHAAFQPRTHYTSHHKQNYTVAKPASADWFAEADTFMNVITPNIFGSDHTSRNLSMLQPDPADERENDYESLREAAIAIYTKGLSYKNAARQFNVTVTALRHFYDSSSGDLWDDD